MSKYTEIRELLKEDIELIVEQRLVERMGDIINTLMPSVLEHVANNIRFETGNAASDFSIRTHQFTMTTGTGAKHYIGENIVAIDRFGYDKYKDDQRAAYQTLNMRLHNLEQKLHENPSTEAAS